MNMLASMSLPQWMLSVFIIFVCLVLMLVVMVQRGRGQGLAGAFGGGGGGGAFGAKTGDVFTWITVVIAVLFLLLNVAGNFALDQTPVASNAADTSTVPPTQPPTDTSTAKDTGTVPPTTEEKGGPSLTLKGKNMGTSQPIEIKFEGQPKSAEGKPSVPAGTIAVEGGKDGPKPSVKPVEKAPPKDKDTADGTGTDGGSSAP